MIHMFKFNSQSPSAKKKKKKHHNQRFTNIMEWREREKSYQNQCSVLKLEGEMKYLKRIEVRDGGWRRKWGWQIKRPAAAVTGGVH